MARYQRPAQGQRGRQAKKLLSSPELQAAFELCELGVGGELSRHPRYLLESITADEWGDWLAWRAIFPSPQVRADIGVGCIRHSVLAPHCKKIDFKSLVPTYGGKKRKFPTAAELAAKARGWCEAAATQAGKIQW